MYLRYRRLLCVVLTYLAVVGPAVAQQDSVRAGKPEKVKKRDNPAPKPLFATTDVLSFTLNARFQPILRRATTQAATAEPQYPALLSTATDAGETGTFPVNLRVRGNFRRASDNCTFPPLYLLLPRMPNTPFARQKKLKLVTHCNDEQYVLKEYLIYQVFNCLTDLSFGARLAQITYADSAKKGAANAFTRWGILLEDDNDLADRNRAVLYKDRYRAEHCDTLTMATVAMFEYMIGNTDWSVPFRHNIRLVTDSSHARPMPVPYDFDHSGLVEAPYAKPAEQLNLTTVRERLYRGPIYPRSVLTQTISRFNRAKTALYALYEGETRLNRAYIRQSVTYLDEFYRLLNDPEAVVRVFQDPTGRGVQIKGLNR